MFYTLIKHRFLTNQSARRVLSIKREKQRKRRLGISAVTIRFTEQSLQTLSVSRVGFDAQFHRLCYKTIGSCF